MARAGAHGADDDRSVLRQLRARAPTHRARHRRHPRCGPRRQQLALFNAHYGEYCFQPIHIFDRGHDASGAVAAAAGQTAVRRGSGAGLAARHRPHPAALASGRDRGRGDGRGTPEVMDFLEDQGCGFIARDYPATLGSARSASRGPRGGSPGAIAQGQSTPLLPDRLPGQLVTRAPQSSPASGHREGNGRPLPSPICQAAPILLYEKVYSRPDGKHDQGASFTPNPTLHLIHRWEANQFRLFLHTGAYWLLHQLRRPRRAVRRGHRDVRNAPSDVPQGLPRIEELGTRIKIALPSAIPIVRR